MTSRYSPPQCAPQAEPFFAPSKVQAGYLKAWIATFAVALAPLVSHANQAQLQLPRTQLGAGMHLIDAQIASTPAQREIGLMYRPEMPPNEGMLFVFEQPAALCFWMKNTLLPLTAAFIADDGSIVNLEDMSPKTTDSHCAKKPVRFVLEMNQGWFKKKGLQPGSKLTSPLFSASKGR